MEKLLRFIGKDIQDIYLDEWLAQKPEVLRPIAIKWLKVISNCGGDVQDIFHDGYPIGCVDDAPFAYVNVFKAHINVGFFYGVDLPDEAELLEGTGKRMRHIKLRPDQEHDDQAIASLILFAYRDVKNRLATNF